MKTKFLKRSAGTLLLGTLFTLGPNHLASGQSGCPLVFPAGGNAAMIDLSAPWAVTGDFSAQNNGSYFGLTVMTGNEQVPAGAYRAWCVDEANPIDPYPWIYNTWLYSSCDANLNASLPAGRSASVYVSPEVWHQVNYLINHKTAFGTNAYFWDVQIALWGLVGGPPAEEELTGCMWCLFPPTDFTVVNQLITDAQNNAASWQVPAGGKIGVLAVTTDEWFLENQIIMLEVPLGPALSVVKEIACLQPGNNCGTFSDSAAGYKGLSDPGFCFRVTVKNNSPDPLTGFSVVDDALGDLTATLFPNPSAALAPGASVTGYFKMDVGADTTNTVTVSALGSLPATDSVTAQILPALEVKKFVSSPDDLDAMASNNVVLLPDDGLQHAVTFSLTVSNASPFGLTAVTITDPALAGKCTMPAPFALAAGASQTLTLGVVPLECHDTVSDCVNPWLGQAMGCTVFQLGNGKVSLSGAAGGIVGNVVIGPKGSLDLGDHQTVSGQVRLATNATVSVHSGATVGAVIHNVDLTGEIADARSAATWAASLPATQTLGDLKTTMTIQGQGGLNVISLNSVNLDKGKVVTLQGGPLDEFIINVKGPFTVKGSSQILLAGGALRKNVLFNIIDKAGPASSDVNLDGPPAGASCCATLVEGTVLAVDSKVTLSPALVNGEVISAKDIELKEGASVRCLSTPAPILLDNTVTVTATINPSSSTGVGCAYDLNGSPIIVQVQASGQVGCTGIGPVGGPLPPACPCTLTYPFTSANPLTSVVFNESEVLRAFSPDIAVAGGTIRAWYNDEHALLLGVRRVIVKTSAGSTTTDFPITPLTSNPGSAVNPLIGTTAITGDLAGRDPMGRPIFPALYITDITDNPASLAGDWQSGGAPIAPHAVFGTWKSTVQTVDKTQTPALITQVVDADPAKNNWNLAGGAAPPAGTVNQGYGAEVRWNVDALGLTPGHTYRLQFMVHDGDQNKVGGDVGEACAIIGYQTPTSPCGGQ